MQQQQFEGQALPALRCCEAGESSKEEARVEGDDCEEMPRRDVSALTSLDSVGEACVFNDRSPLGAAITSGRLPSVHLVWALMLGQPRRDTHV